MDSGSILGMFENKKIKIKLIINESDTLEITRREFCLRLEEKN
jgi:hypothetical protein